MDYVKFHTGFMYPVFAHNEIVRLLASTTRHESVPSRVVAVEDAGFVADVLEVLEKAPCALLDSTVVSGMLSKMAPAVWPDSSNADPAVFAVACSSAARVSIDRVLSAEPCDESAASLREVACELSVADLDRLLDSFSVAAVCILVDAARENTVVMQQVAPDLFAFMAALIPDIPEVEVLGTDDDLNFFSLVLRFDHLLDPETLQVVVRKLRSVHLEVIRLNSDCHAARAAANREIIRRHRRFIERLDVRAAARQMILVEQPVVPVVKKPGRLARMFAVRS